ncbi:uncharacterized protein N7498_006307 [Penicillium cinerascens]|uniref:HNH nuclease domain-containing protein n=1 Tax=Penicillium cinerascens TaxID=70096 RepID=A0A9W9MHV6_9EURO|nr:uncharacterized protein N7498_006307 [Penicillium cinerascens]KAJ5201644.1 hypothetical protein N7498_006307 [Penicillium cinerascens]
MQINEDQDRHQSSLEGVLDLSIPLSLTPQQHESARNLVIRLVRHYGPEKTVRNGYRPAALIQATLEHVTSPDTFMTFFLSYIYEYLCSDEGHTVNSDITHALVFFEGFSSWEPEQINKLYESLEKFAEYIVANFLLPLRASSVKTPQPTPTSLSSLQSSTPTGTRQLISDLRQNYLIRDRHRCVVSRKFDRSDLKKNALRILDMFDPGIIHLIDGPKIDSPMNALTLTLDYHRLFGEFQIYFERTGTPHQYRIDSTEHSLFLRDPLFPVTRSLTLSPHRTIDPPSPRLLDVHRAIALIMKLSGAGEYIERVLRDMEELDVREDGSTNLGYLAGLRLGGWLDTLSVD